jgi:hypothetical protein
MNPRTRLPQVNEADSGALYSPLGETVNNRAAPAQMRAAADHHFSRTGLSDAGSCFLNVIRETEGFANGGKNNGSIFLRFLLQGIEINYAIDFSETSANKNGDS